MATVNAGSDTQLSGPDTSTVTIEVSPGELLDRLGILELKAQHIIDPDRLANVRRELALPVPAPLGGSPPSNKKGVSWNSRRAEAVSSGSHWSNPQVVPGTQMSPTSATLRRTCSYVR